MIPDVQIDRISISVPGIERELGQRLAALVAQRLAAPLRLAPGEASLERLHVAVSAESAEPAESLAARIAEQISLLIAGAGILEAGR